MLLSTMRTTIELPDALRARLLELAALRGEKGFSSLVSEAVVLYLDREASRTERVVEAKAALGGLDDEAADALEASVRAVRATWR